MNEISTNPHARYPKFVIFFDMIHDALEFDIRIRGWTFFSIQIMNKKKKLKTRGGNYNFSSTGRWFYAHARARRSHHEPHIHNTYDCEGEPLTHTHI